MMNDISEFFRQLFSPDSWPARWHCGRWTPFHGWLYIVSNVLIAAAYFSIPLMLFYLIRKSKHRLPFQRVFWLFFLFILACGVTHVFDALMFWYPVYRLSAVILFATAVVSMAAVVGLYKVVPAALSLKSPSELESIIMARTNELEKANRHLQEVNRDLEMARLEAERLVRQKDEFIGIASHELKTPVTSLKAYTQLLPRLDPTDVAAQHDIYTKMEGQVNRLVKLVNDLLDTTRTKDGTLEYTFETFRLDLLVRETVEEMQKTTAHPLQFTYDAAVNVYADKERIYQVLCNLVSNAIKYSPMGQPIVLNLEVQPGEVMCSVRDKGKGIPADQLDKIFEKYYRVEGDQAHTYPGLGLGLFIVKRIIERHKGRIWADSKPGQGTCFYFSIPVH
jgi:signal transduction histidine kinase